MLEWSFVVVYVSVYVSVRGFETLSLSSSRLLFLLGAWTGGMIVFQCATNCCMLAVGLFMLGRCFRP